MLNQHDLDILETRIMQFFKKEILELKILLNEIKEKIEEK